MNNSLFDWFKRAEPKGLCYEIKYFLYVRKTMSKQFGININNVFDFLQVYLEYLRVITLVFVVLLARSRRLRHSKCCLCIATELRTPD